MTKEKVLITGGLGFIFSYVTEYFVEKGYEVVVIDDLLIGAHPEIIDNSFRFINKNLQYDEVIDVIINE
ncbi:MAG: NAD-dependent epimerase/dehydratase family protein, partial [Elusimicrobiota bacterium]